MPAFNRELLRQSEAQMGQETISNKLEIEKAMDLYAGKRSLLDSMEQPEISIEELLQDGQMLVYSADIDLFDDNPNNHWNRIEGEKWEEFVESIRKRGILTPLIVRTKLGNRFEILAGHNRKYAALEAGLTKLPYVVKDVDDVEASVIMGITNNQREYTTDLEWGWAYRNTYESLKKAIGRPKNAESEPNTDLEKNCPTVGQFSNTTRTSQTVAEMYGVGKGTVERKMRLTYLTQQLYDLCLKAKYTQKTMIELSYLTSESQTNVAGLISAGSIVITEKDAKVLREIAREHELSDEEILFCCKKEGMAEEKPGRKARYSVDEALFPSSVKKGDREGYIIKALQYIREHDIVLE